MKTLKQSLWGGMLAILLAATPAAAEGVSFGIVNMNKVMQTAEAAKDALSQLENKRKEYQSQISKEEDSLRKLEKDILKEKEKLSKEEFDKKRIDFEEQVMKGQKTVQERKRMLDTAFGLTMNNLRKEVAIVVSEVAKEKGLGAVLTDEAVIVASPELDITATVIERINKKMKKMKVDWSAAASAAKK